MLWFCLFRVSPAAYGGSQARGPIGAVAASLRHGHSNTGSKPCLRTAPQLLKPLSEARDGTRDLMDTSWVPYCRAMTGTPTRAFGRTCYLNTSEEATNELPEKVYFYREGE